MNQQTQTQKRTQMREAYETLLLNQNTDPEAWRAVHRIAPDEAHMALEFAMLKVGWNAVTSLLMSFTMSPAMLFVRLPGMASFDESQQVAAFTNALSAAEFGRKFPGWTVEYVNGTAVRQEDKLMPRVEVGQRLKRVIGGTKVKRWENQAVVVKVTDEHIVCDVQVDIIRTMTFDAKTWVNVNGREYGWLETGE